MADDSSFRVKNTLVVNGAFVANSTVVNTAAITSTSINTGTANATAVNIGANVNLTTTQIRVGNASSNVVISNNSINVNGATVNSTAFSGTANNATNLNGQPETFYTNATNLATGTVPTARLGSGTPNSTTFLRGDQSYATAVTSVAGGNGLTGTVTTTGSLAVNANNGVIANTTGLFVDAKTGLVANTTGLHVNASYIATISANNATFLNGQAASFYTNATNISAGTLPTARLTGTYDINISGNAATATNATNASNSTNLNGQAASFYTDIPARLGYTPVNRGGDTGMSGDFSTSGGIIQVGRGEGNEKQLRFHNSSRITYFFLNTAATMGLWDLSGGFSRWISDAGGNFTAGGNITAYSDIKLKANIATIENALEKVSNLRGVSYERKLDSTKQIGVIAQEVKEIIPEVVMEDEQGTLSVAYGNMVGLLIEAIKELKSEVDSLREEVRKSKVV